jgi:hypothetical protein
MSSEVPSFLVFDFSIGIFTSISDPYFASSALWLVFQDRVSFLLLIGTLIMIRSPLSLIDLNHDVSDKQPKLKGEVLSFKPKAVLLRL